jgi:hypothetical protein
MRVWATQSLMGVARGSLDAILSNFFMPLEARTLLEPTKPAMPARTPLFATG